MTTEDKCAELTARWLSSRRRELEQVLRFCESPIERLLLLAMLVEPRCRQYAKWPTFVPEMWRFPNDGMEIDPPVVQECFFANSEYPPTCKIAQEARASSGITKGIQVGSDYYGQQMGDVLFLYLQAQTSVDGRDIRVDFAIVSRDYRLAVEVDGHDFHERTKEQAARDRSRDRALLANGWQVLRFTGSEVWRDPDRCAAEIKRTLLTEKFRRETAAYAEELS